MGKRNKFCKIGMNKSFLKTMVKDMNKKKEHTINKSKMLSDEESSEEVEVDQRPNLNKTTINENAVDKQCSILGVDKKDLINVLQNPIRHRRAVNHVVLSKGQKKRLEKKERVKRREQLIEKIKLNNSMINMSSRMNKTTNNGDVSMNVTQKNDQFNLFDINNTIGNMLADIKEDQEEENIKDTKFKNHRAKRNFKKILNEEKEKIKKVMQNKNYQANPLEAMKFHIKNAQIMEERKKKIEENFNRNYNFLNLK